MGRRSSSSAPKTMVSRVFVQLHKLRMGPTMIGKLTGYSDVYVGQVLNAEGVTERWGDLETVRASLPNDLAEDCALLRNGKAQSNT